eukprot:2071218-Rhodomonas_salina.2
MADARRSGMISRYHLSGNLGFTSLIPLRCKVLTWYGAMPGAVRFIGAAVSPATRRCACYADAIPDADMALSPPGTVMRSTYPFQPTQPSTSSPLIPLPASSSENSHAAPCCLLLSSPLFSRSAPPRDRRKDSSKKEQVEENRRGLVRYLPTRAV